MHFCPSQLPSNNYVFTGSVYFNPADFAALQSKARNVSKSEILVKANGFVLKAEPLEAIEVGNFGASSFHREMMMLSKLDKILIQVADAQDLNPLSELNITVDYKILKRDPRLDLGEDATLFKLKEDFISDEIVKRFKGRFINQGEKFALPIFD